MNNKGVVLIMVLWVLMVLALIAWGLGRRSSLEVSVVDTYRGKLRSYAAARAGINKAFDLLAKSTVLKDTLYTTGISIDQEKSPADIFSHIDTGQNSYAIIQWPAKNYNTENNKPHLEYGLRDEQGKINLNAIGANNYQILSALLQIQSMSQSEADKLALAIVNFAGVNAQASNSSFSMDLSDAALKPKNRPYQNILELLEVDGMTQDIFVKIKDDLTVYGNAQGGLWINTDTANNDVIQAVINASARLNPSINANQMIAQAYAIRDGADGRSFTVDDAGVSIASNANPNWPAALQEGNSSYYKARVVGVDNDSGTHTVIEAVIHRAPGAPGEIVSWQRD
jgi:type II secretory pathway component PulK